MRKIRDWLKGKGIQGFRSGSKFKMMIAIIGCILFLSGMITAIFALYTLPLPDDKITNPTPTPGLPAKEPEPTSTPITTPPEVVQEQKGTSAQELTPESSPTPTPTLRRSSGPRWNKWYTTTIDAMFIAAFSDDNGIIDDTEKDPDDDGTDPPMKEMNVASTTVSGARGGAISVDLMNVYPGYSPTVFYTINNIGDIPVKISSVEMHKDIDWKYKEENGPWVDVAASECMLIEPGVVYLIDNDKDGDGDYTLLVTRIAIGDVIEPDASEEGDLKILIEEGAEQNAPYSIDMGIGLVQWSY